MLTCAVPSRNCTKHQVRCDYMDATPSDSETPDPASPERSLGRLSPRTDEPQPSDALTYQDFNIDLDAQSRDLPSTEMQFLHQVSSLTNSLTAKGVDGLTLWTVSISRFMGQGELHPFVMEALNAWSATLIAWSSGSAETRKLSMRYGTLALRGLHDAIGNFTQANSDAVFAASLLLIAQATDWRSWSSLDAGLQSVMATMEPWRYESAFSDFLSVCYIQNQPSQQPRREPVSLQGRYYLLQNTCVALQNLRSRVVSRPVELGCLDRLIDYVLRLQASEPARTPEEQFNHLYVLRKWLQLVPVQILDQSPCDAISLAVIGHFYATALALDPIFPDVGTRFLAMWVMLPLNEVLQRASLVQSQDVFFQPNETQSYMQYPQEMMNYYCNCNPWARECQNIVGLENVLTPPTYTNPGNLSPAFTPAQIYLTPRSSIASTRRSSSYLEVPTPRMQQDAHGFTLNTSQWGAMPSPGFPPVDFVSDNLLDFSEEDLSQGVFNTGFVTPPYEIWT